MMKTFNALLVGGILFIISSFFNFELAAQNAIFPEIEGTWVLDSVQVQEVRQDRVAQRAVRPGESGDYDYRWIRQFTLNSIGRASYKEITDRSVSDASNIAMTDRSVSGVPNTETTDRFISDVSYTIEGKRGKAARLTIDSVRDYKQIDVELLSDSVLLITQAFVTGYNLPDANFFWKLYYHKSEE